MRAGATLLLQRGLVYGLVGLASELAWTGLRGRPRTSLWMFPVYGLAAPLFEPVHDRLRRRAPVLRGAAYGLGFSVVEYASGRALLRIRGEAPWDYSHARVHVHGLVRADYLPLWCAYGLALERVHDALDVTHGAPRRCRHGREAGLDRPLAARLSSHFRAPYGAVTVTGPWPARACPHRRERPHRAVFPLRHQADPVDDS